MRRVVVLLAIGLAIGFYIASTALLGKTAIDASTQIARERSATVLRECTDQNSRHTNTLRELDRVLARALKQHPERRAQIIESRAPTVLLINALAPYQNCQRVLAKSTRH